MPPYSALKHIPTNTRVPSTIIAILTKVALQHYYGKEEPVSKGKTSSLWAKLKAEPVLLLVIIYNPMQVCTRLCSGYLQYL